MPGLAHSDRRRKGWVSLGLLLTTHPRLKKTLHPGQVDPEELFACLSALGIARIET